MKQQPTELGCLDLARPSLMCVNENHGTVRVEMCDLVLSATSKPGRRASKRNGI